MGTGLGLCPLSSQGWLGSEPRAALPSQLRQAGHRAVPACPLSPGTAQAAPQGGDSQQGQDTEQGQDSQQGGDTHLRTAAPAGAGTGSRPLQIPPAPGACGH